MDVTMEVTVHIPNGDYCENCPFLHSYDLAVKDRHQHFTGTVIPIHRCSRFNCDVYPRAENGECNPRIRKCLLCTLTEEQRTALGFALLATLKLMDNKTDIIGDGKT